MAHEAGDYPDFRIMERLEGISTSPSTWIGCSSTTGLTLALGSPVPICTSGRGEALQKLSVLPNNTTQCPWSELEPRQLDPATSALI